MRKEHPGTILAWLLTATLLILAVWDGGGLRAATLPYYNGAAALLLMWLAAHWILRRWQGRSAGWDPLLLAGALFLGYIGLQWWNAGRMLYFDIASQQWLYSPPRHPQLPFAYDRADALNLLQWFFPAWVLGLFLRSQARHNPRTLRIFWNVLALQAGILALAGIIQFMTQSDLLASLWSGRPPGFASFGYRNHAAAYFYLMGAVALGLLYRELFRTNRQISCGRVWSASLIALACLLAANLTLSRAGIIMSWLLAAYAIVYGIRNGWHTLQTEMRINFCAATLAFVVLAAFLMFSFARDPIQARFRPRPAHPQQTLADAAAPRSIGSRFALLQAGWSAFRANLWLGNGPWGFKYELAFHTTPDQWRVISGGQGQANVHNDPVQFLSEFGLAGSALLLATLACLLWPLLATHTTHGALFWLTCAGLGAVGIHSLVDLPFRAPAILWTVTALLAMLPGVSGRTTPPTRDPLHPSTTNPESKDQA